MSPSLKREWSERLEIYADDPYTIAAAVGQGSRSWRFEMKVYTYSEARQKLATILDEVERKGTIRIRRRDGSSFVVNREPPAGSPLDIKGVDLGLGRREIVALVRESRRKTRLPRKR